MFSPGEGLLQEWPEGVPLLMWQAGGIVEGIACVSIAEVLTTCFDEQAEFLTGSPEVFPEPRVRLSMAALRSGFESPRRSGGPDISECGHGHSCDRLWPDLCPRMRQIARDVYSR